MARTPLIKTKLQGEFGPYTAGTAALTMAAADIANLNSFAARGTDIVVAHNTNAGAQTVTITSAPDAQGRTKDIATYSIPAGGYAAFGMFTATKGYIQSDGNIWLQASHADVKLGVITQS